MDTKNRILSNSNKTAYYMIFAVVDYENVKI